MSEVQDATSGVDSEAIAVDETTHHSQPVEIKHSSHKRKRQSVDEEDELGGSFTVQVGAPLFILMIVVLTI